MSIRKILPVALLGLRHRLLVNHFEGVIPWRGESYPYPWRAWALQRTGNVCQIHYNKRWGSYASGRRWRAEANLLWHGPARVHLGHSWREDKPAAVWQGQAPEQEAEGMEAADTVWVAEVGQAVLWMLRCQVFWVNFEFPFVALHSEVYPFFWTPVGRWMRSLY